MSNSPNKAVKDFPEVDPKRLRWQCDLSVFDFETTADLRPLTEIVGQDRAVKALQLGVELYGSGYNIFICGPSGTGRATTIKQLLEQVRPECEPAPDRCYIHNFERPEYPRLLTLPRGTAFSYRDAIDRMIDFFATRIPRLFEEERFQQAREQVLEKYRAKEKEFSEGFSGDLQKENFALVELGEGAGALVVPVVDGQPVPPEKLDEQAQQGKIKPEEVEQRKKRQEELQKEFSGLRRHALRLQRQLKEELEKLEREAVSSLVDEAMEDLKEKYAHAGVREHLEAIRGHLLENLSLFKGQPGGQQQALQMLMGGGGPTPGEDRFSVYRVNVVLGHRDGEGCPVILETSPTYVKLFGTIQRTATMRGMIRSDFTDIRGGSLLEADGGYLIINALDALTEPAVWKALKRTLLYGKLEIQSVADWLMPMTGSPLKPEPIPVNVKLITIGEPYIYDLLYAFEDDFKKIFKVKADFDTEMARTEQTVQQYASLIRKLGEEEKVRPFHKEAVGAVVEQGVRRAGRQDKLTTRLSEMADLVREANYWAGKDGSRVVQRSHVEQAIAERIERHNLIEEKIRELVEKGVLLIDVTGERVGQLNGLSVQELGSYTFGRPVRITASTAMGRQGIINIEREANLSGRFHTKGVAILTGYLRQKFAQKNPLSLAASICFEQSYAGVDGDSASSTEIYALLSSLSGLPLRQEVAVTGSVNQQGDVQAIGGVNYKIEGFYDVCRVKGLTGSQGVIIPRENVADLMLRPDVVEVINQGRFHVFPVSSVEQGIEILTGVKAGERGPDGGFEEGTVYARVAARLRELAEGMKEFTQRPSP